MKPAPFQYHRPESEREALALLQEHGYDAKLLAGGQSLIPSMNFRLAQPEVLINLNRVDS
ncbi:MAG: FAD binding domain-containing protein, partial [Gemmatimonadales bacterium]